jgi:hypothetical protein
MGTISDYLHLKVNLKRKIFQYVNSTTQRCPNKIIESFLIEDFFHLPPVCDIGGAPSTANISENFLKNLKTALTGHSKAWGKLIHEKT